MQLWCENSVAKEGILQTDYMIAQAFISTSIGTCFFLGRQAGQ